MTYTATSIKRLRQSLGLTQVGFAARLGVSPTIISRWECRIYSPSSTSKAKIEALVVLVALQADIGEHIADIERHEAPPDQS